MSIYLERLAEAQLQLQQQQNRVTILAIQARSAGATWTAIARALGVTKQSVQRKYSRYVIDPLEFPGHGA